MKGHERKVPFFNLIGNHAAGQQKSENLPITES
jgi:hypothetical protein